MLVKLPEIAVYRNAAGIRGSRDHICFADGKAVISSGNGTLIIPFPFDGAVVKLICMKYKLIG